MILYKNVCDFCSNEEEIKEGDGQIEINFTLLTLHDASYGKKRHSLKSYSGTFCSKECLSDYMKENITEDGKIRGLKDNE